MSLSAAIFILIVLIIVSAILSSAEISLAGARRIKLQALANEGNIKAEKVLKLQEQPGRFITVVQIGLNQALGNENKLVQIKYYGWRMTMFDEYRNAVAVKEISGDVTPSHPILSWVFYAFLLVTLFLSIQFVRGWFDSEN